MNQIQGTQTKSRGKEITAMHCQNWVICSGKSIIQLSVLLYDDKKKNINILFSIGFFVIINKSMNSELAGEILPLKHQEVL